MPIQSQSFKIIPNGVVRGGSAMYQADLTTGTLQYSALVNLPFWQTKQYPQNGSPGAYQVNPNVLLSTGLQKQGDQVVIGPVTFCVSAVNTGNVTVAITIYQSTVYGTAVLDNSGQYLKIISADMLGQAMGFNFNIAIVPQN